MHWIAHVLGLDNASGPAYLFWSGFGADFSELALFGGLLALLRRHNCHVHKCWRLGRFKHGDYVLCAHHHPNDPPTTEEIETI